MAKVIAVDVPIGLTDAGPRPSDRLAREAVGGHRACSIFSAPVRGILGAKSQKEASALHRTIDGRGFGAQAFAILPKVREWDELLRTDERARKVVCEVHPEVSFALLKGSDGGLRARKKSPEGHQQRVQLLAGHFGIDEVQRALDLNSKTAASDDVLDAMIALWSGQRVVHGTAKSFPAPPAVDALGIQMAIWA